MKKLCSFLLLAALLTAAWIPTPSSATLIGADYVPIIPGGEGGSNFLRNAEWTPTNKAMIQADLNQMVSMGINCQRLMIWPECSGWVLSQYGQGSNYFESKFTEECNNLSEYLGFFADRNMPVVFCLANDYFTGGPGAGQSWWAWAYGTGGYSTFMIDSLHWYQGFVDAVNNSPYAYNVPFIDMQNEVYTTPAWTNYPDYVRQVYDSGHVPAAKKGFSVLRVPQTGTTDYDTLKTTAWLGSTRAAGIKLTDSHCYPELDANDWKLETKYDRARTAFPGSTTIIGEYAYSDSAAGEATQATNALKLTNQIITKGIPYAMNWSFVDYPTATPPTFGLARGDINHPKDAMGKLVDRLSLFTNGDYESGTSTNPTGWGGGSNGGHALTFIRQSGQDCTGNWFYRISAPTAPDNIYTLSPYTAIPAGSSYIYANAYIRGGNTGNICIGIHQYDANGNWLGYTAGPSFNSDGTWQWVSYQQAVGGWRCPTNPNARYIYLGVVADVTYSNALLDTDCVSLQVR